MSHSGGCPEADSPTIFAVSRVMFPESGDDRLRAFRAQRGRTVEIDDTLFLGARDQIVDRRGETKIGPRHQRHQSQAKARESRQ